MKCPHCNYEHGWSGELGETVNGSEGGFYHLGVEMKRRGDGGDDTVTLYACPSCKKTFIGYDWEG